VLCLFLSSECICVPIKEAYEIELDWLRKVLLRAIEVVLLGMLELLERSLLKDLKVEFEELFRGSLEV